MVQNDKMIKKSDLYKKNQNIIQIIQMDQMSSHQYFLDKMKWNY